MRKGRDGGETKTENKLGLSSAKLSREKFGCLEIIFEVVFKDNTSLAPPGALAHRVQCRTVCNTSPPSSSKMANGVPK